MQSPAICAAAGPLPNRWETLCALQGLLPLLKRAAVEIDRTDMVFWFEQADAEVANIIKGRPSDAAAIPALIVRSPQNPHPCTNI
ncbi:hypothetical protein EN829_005230 [Mesorhizobium sp. M00.F.Ca.ET.186.01.1.1]|nr:hypothetical protein EN848_03435 [bacterium M00.F.Ca.ET.205.01.1.1]TGU54882.1 hypothetical protein EN795_07850 [bacterium M00.F.Ca.ET.152.01.1.1]TGV38346.1 hypothetical protein EN829_005230 [Mesorhizobium sp. M00.F.Ca.ET.186.01.1.1]TGZ44454.1 hypothetical protein EN805_07855 [bacterium M00.F.Ca.ET.162.01.1.1]TIW62398.1 MAG: hypothetical protein E5V48_05230 [Mesorhizobium sp.]